MAPEIINTSFQGSLIIRDISKSTIKTNNYQYDNKYYFHPVDLKLRKDQLYSLYQDPEAFFFGSNYKVGVFIDQRRKNIWMFRSLDSIEELYYTIDDGNLIFSNTINEINVGKKLNFSNFSGVVSSIGLIPDETIYDNIKRVPAGEVITISERKIQNKKYYSFSDNSTFFYKDLLRCSRTTRELFHERASHFEGKTIGVFLSGGIDSACVAASLKPYAKKVIAYHLEFGQLNQINEKKYAEAVARKLKIELRTIDVQKVIKYGDYYKYTHPPVECPFAHISYKSFENTAMMAKDEVEIITSGHLGDAIFGEVKRSGLWHVVNTALNFSFLNSRHLMKYSTTQNNLNRLKNYEFLLSKTAYDSVSEICYKMIERKTSNLEEELNSIRETILHTDLFMKFGLKLDHFYQWKKIILFSKEIPDSFKLLTVSGRIINKLLLRHAFQNELPKEVITRTWRPALGAFSEVYFNQHRKQFIDLFKDSTLEKYGILNPDNIQRHLGATGKVNIGEIKRTPILTLGMAELWLRLMINKILF